jgi:glycosyltransferase involved in cell wall biosynthesis
MWGNLRDLFFLILIGRKLREKLVVHLHGANFDVLMEKSPGYIKWLNKRLYKDIKAAIILGKTFETIFDGYIDRDKVKTVINYYDPSLLIPVDKIAAKFGPSERIKILYLSNIMKEKGYKILLDAFLKLPEQMRERAELHYAGTIKEDEKKLFLGMIKNVSNIYYHGCVVGMEKRDLFWSSQIFCLPTVFKFEGQPISILEAYASGCCVITTSNGGIKDVFSAPENGIVLDQNLDICANELQKSLEDIILNIEAYSSIGLNNRTSAKDIYHKDKFTDSITNILIN